MEKKNAETAHCVDSCRYLESCNVPITMKRKCHSSSNTTSSNSDDDKQKGSDSMQVSEGMCPRCSSYHQRITDPYCHLIIIQSYGLFKPFTLCPLNFSLRLYNASSLSECLVLCSLWQNQPC